MDTQKTQLAWRVIAEVMAFTNKSFAIGIEATSGGLGHTYTLYNTDGALILWLNTNSTSGGANGVLETDVWNRAEYDLHALVAEFALAIHREPGIADDTTVMNISAAADWITANLADQDSDITWAWADGQDGFGDYSGPSLSKEEELEIPDAWLQIESPLPEFAPLKWVWTLRQNGEAKAHINLLLNEVVHGQPNQSEELFKLDYETASALGKYVYALRDPRDGGQVFYVGKGTGDRLLSHKKFSDENPDVATEKLDRIKEIESAGFEVEHLLLRTGLESDEEALKVEQAVIDAYAAAGLELTNLVKGHHSDTHGLTTLTAFVQAHGAEPMGQLNLPIVMFKIQNKWNPTLDAAGIYKATREHWVVGSNTRTSAKYAFGVAYGIIRGIYRIDSWMPSDEPGLEKRWMFDGVEATELSHFIGTKPLQAFRKYAANPVITFLDGYPG